MEVIKQMGENIEKELDFEMQNNTAYFEVQRPQNVFLFSNTIRHNMVVAEHLLIHESLHAAIYDLVRNYITHLNYYSSRRFDDKFMHNVLAENVKKPLISNKKQKVFSNVSAKYQNLSPEILFQYYSFEEDFVMFNTVCHLIEQEFNQKSINCDKLMYFLSLYCGSAGLGVKGHLNNESVNLYGKKLPINEFIGSYLEILNGPKASYDEEDRSLACVIDESLNLDHTRFKKIDSVVPGLVDKIYEYVLKYGFRQNEIQSMVLNAYNQSKQQTVAKMY